MTKAIVTGCAGFIGSHLVEKLTNEKWDVVGIDNFHPYYSKNLKISNIKQISQNTNFKFIEGSILNDEDLEKLPKETDYLFHFAAIAGVRNSIKNPDEYFEINVEGTKKILKKYSHGKVIFASTSSVYGEVEKNEFPVNEKHNLKPISPYGESKKKAEQVCLEIAEKNKLELTMLRFYTVYGPRQRPDEAFTKFIRLIQENKSIPVYGDGSKERDFTYVSDIVDGVFLAAKKGTGVYNLGSGNPISLNKMIDTIEKIMNKKIVRDYVDSPIGDVQKTHAEITKAKEEICYEPKIKFEEGVKNCINWCLESSSLLKYSKN